MNWAESSREFHQVSVLAVALQKDGDSSGQSHALVDYAMRFALYSALTAIFLMITALVIKLMWNCDEEEGRTNSEERTSPTENTRLLSPKKEAVLSSYGTSEDLESGSCASSSSEDLYDGRICVICYDDQRNCFFVPCGHCIACSTCARRIMKEESKSCPICRGIIDKVRKLQMS